MIDHCKPGLTLNKALGPVLSKHSVGTIFQIYQFYQIYQWGNEEVTCLQSQHQTADLKSEDLVSIPEKVNTD